MSKGFQGEEKSVDSTARPYTLVPDVVVKKPFSDHIADIGGGTFVISLLEYPHEAN